MPEIKKLVLDDPDTHSADIIGDNIQALEALFPEAFKEGGIDFDVLKQLLGTAVDEKDEKYGLNWHGKRKARQIALTPSTGTLLPCPDESVDWDTTQNLMIEGDNLEVLKLLQKSYAGKVKLIYIDPPYNTGKDFVYPDNFQDSIRNYLSLTGQIDEGGQKASSNTESSGRFHTDWLNMMYPRLKIMRSLLKDDGVLCVSINDKEQASLKHILNEIFGEENFLAQIVWDKNHSAQAGLFKIYHEFVMIYARSAERLTPIKAPESEDFEAGAMKKQSARHPLQKFTFPKGTRFDATDGHELTGSWGETETVRLCSGRMLSDNGKLSEDVELEAAFTQANQMKQFFYGDRDTLVDSRGQRVLEFYFTSTGKLKVTKERGVFTPPSVQRWGMQGEVSTELAQLFGMSAPPLETPKSVNMMRDLIQWFTGHGDIVADFFAGSGTSGHAVTMMNALTDAQRRFLLVQFPEECAPDSEAGKAGFKTISDICKRRLVLASEKFKAENNEAIFDAGFRFYKLAPSNIVAWEPEPSDLEGTLLASTEHLVAGRSEQDVLYELLLKLGLDLCVPIEEKDIAGKAVHSIGGGALIVCLADGLTTDTVETVANGIVAWRKELAPAVDTRVVFKDSGFADDVAKANMAAILNQNGVLDVRSL